MLAGKGEAERTMATRRKPAAKKIKFELSRSGLAGVGIVCFCIFLWMFLLGVWAGQSMLLPPIKDRGESSGAGVEKIGKGVPHIKAETAKKIIRNG